MNPGVNRLNKISKQVAKKNAKQRTKRSWSVRRRLFNFSKSLFEFIRWSDPEANSPLVERRT